MNCDGVKITNVTRWVEAQIQQDYKNGVSKEIVRKKIKNNEYGFNHSDFQKYKIAQKEQDDYISNPPEVEEGIVNCVKCHSNKVYSFTIQTRASDEAMSVHSTCTECKYSWISSS